MKSENKYWDEGDSGLQRKSVSSERERSGRLSIRGDRMGSMRLKSGTMSKKLTAIKTALENEQIDDQTALGLAAFDTNAEFDFPEAVGKQSFEVQLHFRRQLFGCLLAELLLCVLLGQVIPPLDENLSNPVLGGYFVLVLLLSRVVYKSPANMAIGIVVAVSQAVVISMLNEIMRATFPIDVQPLYIVFISVACGVLPAVFVSTISVKNKEGEKTLISFKKIYVLVLPFAAACSILYWFALDHNTKTVAEDESAKSSRLAKLFCAGGPVLLLGWYIYDAFCICKKVSADERVAAVLFFYTDQFLVVVYVLMTAFFSLMCGGGMSVTGALETRKVAVTNEDEEENT